ncbi:MAG: DUF4296 domain-containing protein [Bacteroidota bacterium]
MKNFIYITTFVLLILGCKPGVPKDLIQPDKMALVLHDIHIFDSYIVTETNRDTALVIAASYYNAIYKKFGIDSALYSKSLSYYTAHPKVMDLIYKDVTDQLKKEKDKIIKTDSLLGVKSAKAAKAKMKTDSIKKAEAAKIVKEQEKLKRQLDSLRDSRLSPKEKKKKQAELRKQKLVLQKKRADSVRKHSDSLKKVQQLIKRLDKRIQ